MSVNVPNGYKQTKVGVIPEEWEVVRLGDIAFRISVKNSKNEVNKVFSNSAINGIVMQNEYFDKDIANKNNLTGYYIVENGDFVYNPRISKYAPAGPINRNWYPFSGIVSPLYTVFRVKNENVVNFLEYFFSSTLWLRYMQGIANYGARHDRMNITNSDFMKMPIPLPPLKEQQKIAQILTTWDRAISKQEALIVEKEQLKKGLMQKLLSGEVRFGGFDEEWEEVRLGNIGKTYGGLTKKKAEDFGQGNAKYITYKNIFDNSKININILDKVNINANEKQNKVQYGDILFTTSSEIPEEVGMSSVLLDKIDDLFLNSFCFGFRPHSLEEINPYFARFYFRSFYMRDKISRLAQGSTRFNLSKLQVMKIKIKLPSKQEQQKIAQLLTTADKEIELLKEELEVLKEQKRGLMQKLLTGEVRTNKLKKEI